MSLFNWLDRLRRIEELANDDAGVLADAMRHLEIVGDDEVLTFLAGCLLEYSREVAAAARRVLLALGDDGAVFLLIDRLKDPKAGWYAAQTIREFATTHFLWYVTSRTWSFGTSIPPSTMAA